MAKKSPASILKQKGLIPKEWNLRSLSRGQKSWITKQSKTFSEVIKKPAEFSTISAKSKKHKLQAVAAGLPVTNNRAVVRTSGGRVRRRGDKIIVTNSERKIELWFANSKNFTKALAKAHKRKLKPNQVWAFHIGDRINNVQYKNLNDMLHYLGSKQDWHSPDATSYISLVLITENRRHIIAHHPGGDDEGYEQEDEDFDD